MSDEATGSGFARITVSVSVPGGLAGALATSYTPGHGGVTVGAIGGRTISCTAREQAE